jgi:hypothetical protein
LRGRSPDRVPEDPRGVWLQRLDVDSRPSAVSHFDRFMRWLHTQSGWEYVTPRDLLIRHIQAEDDYVVLELVQRYIGQLHLRKSSKRKAYSTIRSFFSHSYCALPVDPNFRIRGDKPPVQGKLGVGDIVEVYHAANPRNRSLVIFKWQSFLDSERLEYVNRNLADHIVDEIKRGTCPIRLDLPGRKENENDAEGTFYTFIHEDAIDALTKYWDERGYRPGHGEPLWTIEGLRKDSRELLNKAAFESMWLRLLRHTGKIPGKRGPVGSRYGFNMHEMRDCAATYLHVKAKAKGLDMDCVKFWSGRTGELDPNKYDKFFQDGDWVRSQYELAAPYLNIISKPPAEERELQKMGQENEELRKELAKQGEEIKQLRILWQNAFEKKITD